MGAAGGVKITRYARLRLRSTMYVILLISRPSDIPQEFFYVMQRAAVQPALIAEALAQTGAAPRCRALARGRERRYVCGV